MKNKTDDLRIINTQELVSPREIIDSISPSEKGFATIINARNQIKNILKTSGYYFSSIKVTKDENSEFNSIVLNLDIA